MLPVEQEVVAELSRQAGLPVSTAMSATVQAMKHLKIRSTVVATAYKESINQPVKQYHEDGGVEVLAIKGLEVSKPVDQVKLPDYASYKVAARALSSPPRHRQSTDSRTLALRRLHPGTRRRHAKARGIQTAGSPLGIKVPTPGFRKLLRARSAVASLPELPKHPSDGRAIPRQ